MTFQFKQKSRDFYVSENLPFKLSGSGDAFFVYISKRNITTYDIIDHLRSELGITRMSLGIAGLKDKKAIAKQWISIYDRALNKVGGEKAFLNSLSKICKVIETGRHHTPLNMSTPITNTFHITFSSTKNLWQEEKQKSLQIVQELLDDGYPNLFWSQRFGINGRNSTQWYEIMTGTSKERYSKADMIFKLQAFSSKVFNEFVASRARNSLDLLDGDILSWTDRSQLHYGIYSSKDKKVSLVDIRSDSEAFLFVPHKTSKKIVYNNSMVVTGPVPGHNMARPDPKSPAGKREADFMTKQKLDKESMKVYSHNRVYGLRRPIRVYPTKSKVRYKEDNLLVDFTLPSGSYASIVFDALSEALR